MEAVLREVNGYTVADGKPVPGFGALKADGSTACGCWIYSGIFPDEGRNLARNRQADGPDGPGTHLGWGFSWPANRRILYNRASADPDGVPWSERKKYVWWDTEAGRWSGYDTPDFPVAKAPDTPADPNGVGLDFHSGSDPFIMMADGKGWLYSGTSLQDGPLPTHYELFESPVRNALYPQQTNPAVETFDRPDNRYNRALSPEYPYIITTYRLTEHHTAGAMTRWVPWLAELQPQGFLEISPALAEELDIKNGDWVLVSTARAEIETRALVTGRMKPLTVEGRTVHQVGMPWHFGFMAIARGEVANDLSALVGDPNVHIHEGKVFTCNVRAGRRERRRRRVEPETRRSQLKPKMETYPPGPLP